MINMIEANFKGISKLRDVNYESETHKHRIHVHLITLLHDKKYFRAI